MNAIQFIKENGVEKARELLARLHKLGCPDDMQITVINGMWHRTANGFTYPDLKRLVESVDLIGKYHSIDHAKNHYNNMREALNQYQYQNKDIEDLSNELKQAIADYESIYSDNDMVNCEILDYPEDYTSPNCKKYDERVK